MSLTIGGTEKLNGIRHFSISRESCNNATIACRKYCYGSKGNFLFQPVIDAYNTNYELSQLDNFVESMNELISVNERFFRVHAVGDFYDIDYFYKWIEIAKDNPHITFLAYTRNDDVFGWQFQPDNFRLIYSMDHTTKAHDRIHTARARKALVVDSVYKNKPHLTKEYFIQHADHFKVCTSADCIKCLECWTGNDNIAFPQKWPLHNP